MELHPVVECNPITAVVVALTPWGCLASAAIVFRKRPCGSEIYYHYVYVLNDFRVVDVRWRELGRRRKWRTFVNNAQTSAQLLAAWGAFRVSVR